MWAYNFLRTKYFHEVSPASLHAYSLKSRYGIVRDFKEERMTKVEWYAISTSTTLESNKSLKRMRQALMERLLSHEGLMACHS
jgi:hypothetical protein